MNILLAIIVSLFGAHLVPAYPSQGVVDQGGCFPTSDSRPRYGLTPFMKTLWLKVYLNEKLSIQLVRSERESLFKGYEALTKFPGSIGHYDWLRSSSGQILGVRYWPFDDSIHSRAVQILKTKCQSLDYAFVDADSRYLSILFSKAEDIDDTISNDQDMGENGIYSAKGEKIALCFEVDPPFEKHFPILCDSLPS